MFGVTLNFEQEKKWEKKEDDFLPHYSYESLCLDDRVRCEREKHSFIVTPPLVLNVVIFFVVVVWCV